MTAIDRAIAAAGTQADLARALGVLPQHLTNWRKRGIPADRCPDIERVTGLRCEELRPELQWNRDEAGQVTGYTIPLPAKTQAA